MQRIGVWSCRVLALFSNSGFAKGAPEREKLSGGMQPFGHFPKGWVSLYCHGSREKSVKKAEQKVNRKEKLTLGLHRNWQTLLGNLPLP